MRLVWFGRALALVAVLGLTVANTSADSVVLSAKAKLTGFQESPPKLTNGTGTFSAKVSGGTLAYTLTYSGLSSNATQAHIHFAQPGVNGAVIVWLCQTPAVTGFPVGTPMCPLGGGTVSGTVKPADFITVGTQGFNSGDLNGLLRILRSGVAYANVHSVTFPGGEIRGLIKTNGDGED